MRRKALPGLLAALMLLGGWPARAQERIVSAGGVITEILLALGAGDRLIAVDQASLLPPELSTLPRIGYARRLSAEGILSLNPTLILVEDDAGPAETLRLLEAAGVPVTRIPGEPTIAAAEARLRQIGATVGQPGPAAVLVQKMQADLAQAASRLAAAPSIRPKVLFIYARSGGVMNVAGRDTAADTMITLAGGTNAISGYEGYKPLTAEAVVAAAPDVILLTSRSLENSGGIDDLLQNPALALTPAAQNRRVIAMNDVLLLGFGPRLGEAVLELGEKLASLNSQPLPSHTP